MGDIFSGNRLIFGSNETGSLNQLLNINRFSKIKHIFITHKQKKEIARKLSSTVNRLAPSLLISI
jgi:hypothetical protein